MPFNEEHSGFFNTDTSGSLQLKKYNDIISINRSENFIVSSNLH